MPSRNQLVNGAAASRPCACQGELLVIAQLIQTERGMPVSWPVARAPVHGSVAIPSRSDVVAFVVLWRQQV